MVLSGTVRYERLMLTATGVGPATELRAARFVDVEAHDATTGVCYGRVASDGTGAYSVSIHPPAAAALFVRVASRTLADPQRDYTVHEADPPGINLHNPANAFVFDVGGIAASGDQTVNVDVPYHDGSERPSIGFGCLDVIVTGADRAAGALGAPAPVHVYTRLGNNTALGGTSFYSPAALALALLGGAAGNLDNSDTDYFDDAVIAHELSHLIEDVFSFSMNRGGPHGGEPVEPPLAFSEGSATGLGMLLLRNPLYVDSVGTSGVGLFSFNVENVVGPGDVGGIGGELSVAEIVWDLGDEPAGDAADSDGDGVFAPLADLYAALASFDALTDAPYVGLFLDRVVALSSSVSEADITGLMASPENQGISYPLTGDDLWPPVLVLGGGTASGTADSLAGPGKNQCRGLESSVWYRMVVVAPTFVTIDLDVIGDGMDGDNLDLFLTTNTNVFVPFESSTSGGAADEQITASLGAGNYIVRVEAPCAGSGNRADFDLTAN